MAVCVRDRIDLKAELKLDDKPHPEERWEGKLTFKDQETTHELFMSARLLFGGGLMEGQGGLSYEGQHVLNVAVSGEVSETGVTFAAWVDGMETARGRLDCTGELGSGGTSLVGSFTHGCINPGQCGADCKGGRGDFDLMKVVD